MLFRSEEDSASADRTGASITKDNIASLRKCDRKINAFGLWDKVNKLTRPRQTVNNTSGITAHE